MFLVIKQNAFQTEIFGNIKAERKDAAIIARSANVNENRDFAGPDEMRYEYWVAELVRDE
jgi:hypothetical protein